LSEFMTASAMKTPPGTVPIVAPAPIPPMTCPVSVSMMLICSSSGPPEGTLGIAQRTASRNISPTASMRSCAVRRSPSARHHATSHPPLQCALAASGAQWLVRHLQRLAPHNAAGPRWALMHFYSIPHAMNQTALPSRLPRALHVRSARWEPRAILWAKGLFWPKTMFGMTSFDKAKAIARRIPRAHSNRTDR